jgi:hypothetical protein
MIKMLYNRCTGIYKFGNNTYPRRIRCRSNLGHTFREKKCVLWAGKYGICLFHIFNVDVPEGITFSYACYTHPAQCHKYVFLGLPLFISFPVSWFQILFLIPLFICHSNITSICLHLCKTLLIVPGVKTGTQHNLHFLTFLISKCL